MQIVIDINENEYLSIKNYPDNITSYPVTIHLYEAVRNGTPLPGHHGRLIDADAFVKYCADGLSFFLPMFKTEEYRNLAIDTTKSIIKDIKEAPTIIPATKEGE